ncbi:hypothetical protein [Chitinophaga arvensicola]|uniref:Polyketide cyclase / dehydrase and lipid transport n=1 Tax=Chitinophaga arvensicola TaxID=29529 RepID=A0A1I0SDA6_9BACT|nr:hypothetical protein [Chitinophaga arvensicola]SEW55902.1 hypothetical protein SAMN04488122_6508 [Chitinophaga arvensicola]
MRSCLLTLICTITLTATLFAQSSPDVAGVKFGVLSEGIRVTYRVTPDALERNWLDTGNRKIDSSVVKLSAAQWQRSRFVIDSIPSLLLTAGATTHSWGCLSCRDQPVILVEVAFTDKRRVMSYRIDSDTSRIPEVIRRYVSNVENAVTQLINDSNKKK